MFINIKSWMTFVKLVGNLSSRRLYSQECGERLSFHVIRVLFSCFFLVLFVSSSLACAVPCSSLVCVVPWSTTWTFTSNVKALTLSGLSVSSIFSGAMNSVSKHLSICQSHSHYYFAQHPITWILGPLRHHCQYENVFFGYYLIFNSLLINPSQLQYN